MYSLLAMKAMVASAPLAASDPIHTFLGNILGDATLLVVVGAVIAAVIELFVHRAVSKVIVIILVAAFILWFATNYQVIIHIIGGVFGLA